MPSDPLPAPAADSALASSRRLLAACLAVIFLASFLASRVQTSGGRVRVSDVKFPTQDGQWVVADLYRPLAATPEKPAPLVVVVPGFQRSKETQVNIAIELARRGVVAIVIDPYAQGSSSASMNQRAATNEGYGAFAVVNYVANTDTLNYVDPARIGVTGHSAGGNAAIQAAAYFGAESTKKGTPSKVHSVYVSGYVLTLTDRILRNVRSNLGLSYALYDEGAYRNELQNGDMRRAPEALRFVNSALGSKGKIDTVELGHAYGDAAARTLRIVHNEPITHPFQPYSLDATAHQLAYFQKVFGLEGTLPPDDQVWYWKELWTLLALVAAFVSLVPLARLLLSHVDYFRPLVHPLPPAPPRPAGARGVATFWTLFLAGAVIACFSYIPLTELAQKLFPAATAGRATWFFPQRMNNGVMLWALTNGLIGFGLFLLGHAIRAKPAASPDRAAPAPAPIWGAATTARELWRTAVLAAVVFALFYLTLAGVYAAFHVDYRFLFLGARLFQPAMLAVLPLYLPPFLVFFLSNSLRVNAALRFAGQPEWRGMLLGAIGNSLGLILILLVQYVTFARTGTVYWTESWLNVNLLFAVVPMMFILPYFHRHFFRLTGRIYLGPLTTCPIFIMMLLANSVCYLPL